MDDTTQIDLNEYRRLDRAVKERMRLLDDLEKAAVKTRLLPMRYVLDFRIPTANPPPTLTRSFQVRQNASLFRLRRMAQAVVLVGTTAPGVYPTQQQVRLTLPKTEAVSGAVALRYDWQCRDSYSDRAWSNVFLPAALVSTSMLEDTILGHDQQLPGGTEVSMTLRISSVGLNPFEVFSAVSEYTLQVSFLGDEIVPLESA